MKALLLTFTLLASTCEINAAMPPPNYNTKTCCNVHGQCVVVRVYNMCPRGYY
jgi:hypothetical protein